MDLRTELEQVAKGFGFERVYVVKPERLDRWGDHVATRTDYHMGLPKDDPRTAMPQCRSVILMVWPYQPYAFDERRMLPSAYYVASNKANQAADEVAAWLTGEGHEVQAHSSIPLKALAERAGAGKYGRNSIIAAEGFGSRIVFQALLTDAELPAGEMREGHEFSDECQGCQACVKACPVDALTGDGIVKVEKCLRAQPYDVPFPEEWRHLIGGSIIGCDLCQDVCPRNRAVERVEVPEEVASALSLERLLGGDVSEAAEYIGKNYARAKRLQARACLIAANLKGKDCLPLIEPLLEDDSELVRDAARWAVKHI